MPRPGGESDKLGNQFEAIWTVETALDVFTGRFRSITVEPFGPESEGVEFYVETLSGNRQYHSVKRQKQGGDWSIADLCRPDRSTGRSVLGDLFSKRDSHPDAELCFVSSTGANELRELYERAKASTSAAAFHGALSATLRTKFDQKVVPLCNGNAESALAALKSLEVILRSHHDLIRTVERRIDELFVRVDRPASNAADVRRLVAEFIVDHLDTPINAELLRQLLCTNGIGVRDWNLEKDPVGETNRRYRVVAETELINSSHIARDVVPRILATLTTADSRGVLLVAPGGFGKSCVLTQCLSSLESNETPHLCLRMDSLDPCNTTRQLGLQLDLPASPAVTLAGIADNAPSVLVIDQLDAMSLVSGRNPRMWEVFSELCAEVRSYPHMKMLLACRDFDLNHDHRLRTLGHDQSGFSKVELGKLTKEEIQATLVAANLSLAPTDRQVDILGVPFHLLLFLEGDPSRGFASVGDLYDRYWERKRRNVRERLGRDPRWNEVVDGLTRKMSEQQVLFAPKSICDDWSDDASAMASEHVLTEVPNRQQYRFFHESFFDYAYARRFCVSNRNVVDFLESTEQHLFRRAQVRQILAYRREHDFTRYLADIRQVFDSPTVRFHIKRMVASGFRQIEQPRPEEWKLVEPYLLEGEVSRYVSSALRDHAGWFDLLESQHVFEHWLASDDPRLNNAAIWYLEAHQLHETRSARIAKLIAPYVHRDSEDWKQHILRLMSWGIAHNSEEMAAIYLDMIARGAYDDYKSNVSGSDFWSQLHEAQKKSPRFIIDVLATWFDRVSTRFDDGTTGNFLDKCQQNHSHSGSMIVGKAAADEPEYFVEKILPRMASTVLRTEEIRGGRMLNRAWPFLSNYGEAFDINDAMLLSVRRSLEHIARHNVDLFRRHVAVIIPRPHDTFAYLLLRSWAENPREFANECAEYLIADQRRLNVGYGMWSGRGKGTGESAISRIALKAISPHCAPELLERLESQIIGYCDEYEKQTPRIRGYAELLVLRSLDSTRISRKAQLRIEELERKFPDLSDAIPEEATDRVKCVVSPIPEKTATIMTDQQWISAMQKYDGTTDRFEGGPIELSRLLADLARSDRPRFASLVAKIPATVNPTYFSAILDGLCSRYASLSKEEKDVDQKDIDATPTEVFLKVIDCLHALPGKPCGSAIVGCIGKLSEREIPERVFDIVSYYAMSDPDPREEVWQQDAGGNKYYGGDPHFHGINSVRGQAAETIRKLLFGDHARLDKLRPALIAMSEDPSVSVRTCAIEAFLPLLNVARDFAVELFLKACGREQEICATHPFDHFVHYAIHTHYTQLRELLQFALGCGNEKATDNAARQIVLAELQDVDVGSDVAKIQSGNDAMRKAAADVYARNICHETVGDKCAEHLEVFFTDPSEAVKGEVSSAFFHMPGERLLQLKAFIARFIESPCFENETDRLLYALEQSHVELPHVICRSAERILGFLGEEGTHIAYHGSRVAHSISTLIVRQYEQATNDVIKARCLDLIDQMERVGYWGIGQELAKIDR